jgi:MEDS: MEthanogen/methylotroph, DcmR Sensory domain
MPDRPEPRPFLHGNHICALYDTPEEQVAIAVQYVADGLRLRERCLYVADSEQALDEFCLALSAAGVSATEAVDTGALLLLTTRAAHLMDGHFDCERMLAMLNDAVEDALNAGFAALRTCGDMSWLLADAPGSNQVVEYEGLLNQFFQNVRALGMCQYDRSRLSERHLHMGLATHSSAVVDGSHVGNPLFQPWPFAHGEGR